MVWSGLLSPGYGPCSFKADSRIGLLNLFRAPAGMSVTGDLMYEKSISDTHSRHEDAETRFMNSYLWPKYGQK